MRVIAGTLGGRTFESPHSTKTHPMSDKVRGALFNMLGDIEGLTVLDPFAGTGALSFEAVSRGAVSALAIESDKIAQRAITDNIKALQLQEQVTLVSASADAWLGTADATLYDVVLLDPPYNNLQPDLLIALSQKTATEGILVLSWPGAFSLPPLEGFVQVAQRSHGDAQLGFYTRVI